MFGRRKSQPASAPASAYVERAGAKNRPTPKRRDQQAARKRPLVPADRKAAAAEGRQRARLERARQRQAMLSGDEAHLPARDSGPVRRFLRDGVDSRINMGEFLLPVMVVVLLLSFAGSHLKSSSLLLDLFALVYLLILVALVDAALLARRLRRKAAARFGEAAIPRGAAMYTVMRAFQLRRTRLPRPMVKRGQRPA